MLEGITKSIKEDNGNISSTRITMYATLIVILGIYLFHNIFAIIRIASFVDFPVNSVIVLGIVLTGKVTQKFAENKSSKVSEEEM